MGLILDSRVLISAERLDLDYRTKMETRVLSIDLIANYLPLI